LLRLIFKDLKMQRYAIIKNGAVINVVEYEIEPVGVPQGFEEGVFAIANNTSSIGWEYANGVFTNPNPPPQFILTESTAT
jgi:hypothetical protein